MTSDADLIPVPPLLISEVCQLLEYGCAKDCADAQSLLLILEQNLLDYRGRPALPLPAALLHRLHQVLLVLCYHAITDFPPGEQVVRFSRSADRIRALIPIPAPDAWPTAPAATPREA
ncbi:hypothetical protein ACIRF8_35640 [Streptomyces sp. NPDC102406]|uniref:hypothetical protein n=1 Tax=Streptomyces sp. NPDC102406 TaxID=3366171 RepID=UPI003827FD60